MAESCNCDIERFRVSTQAATAGVVIGGIVGGPVGAILMASIFAGIGDDIAKNSGHCKPCGGSDSCTCDYKKK